MQGHLHTNKPNALVFSRETKFYKKSFANKTEPFDTATPALFDGNKNAYFGSIFCICG